MPPITHASDALWNRACSAADASTSGRNQNADEEALAAAFLSDETSASEAAPLVYHGAVKLAFCGGVSGALAKTCTAPLARLTILYQVRALTAIGPPGCSTAPGLVAALRHVVATEGVRSLWKGNMVTILHRIPYSATNFWAYEATKQHLQQRVANETARAWVAGAVAGALACTAVYDQGALGRLRYADVVRALYAEGGAAAFYRGIGAEYAKVLPGMAIAFTAYETLKRLTGAGVAA
ncbi:Mitochondrial substrate carrier family protein P [Tetrabaena socialis]|uniref:Mitochondrial substrate carrier family protein P n=1 Tax=Tetrabaena socialis TaxID=47790 RepID=A0A2J8AKF3_9CHLO|nr:Mitochondrial substrate carrier family protein P [Tetrabaena socialis]|eukprot:PNH12988.1 Mitochondrial substrate carrier family protein P [Tetrabaena socialis]